MVGKEEEKASFFAGDLQSAFQWELRSRVEAWIRIRLIIAALLFLLSFLLRPTLSMPYPVVPILAVVLLLVGFNSFSHLFLDRRFWTRRLGYIQIAMDLFIITAILQNTGGVDSPFGWLYLLLIVATGLIGGFRLTMVVAFLSLGLYAAVLLGQYYFYLPHYHVGHLATHADVGFRNIELVSFSLLSNAFAFIATGVVAGYVAEIAEQRKKQVEAASRYYKEAILRRVTAAQEEERKRIARELHDDTGQSLTSLLLNLEILREENCLPGRVRERIHSLQSLTTSLLESLRTIISDLRPSVLDDLGLIPSLKWYLQNRIEPLGLKSSIVVHGQPVRLPEPVEISIYRVIQEAVTNVVKHACASEMLIIFRFNCDRIRIIIQDNGQGFRPASLPVTNKWGIVGMKERIGMLGGSLDISSSPGEGTEVIIEVPIQREIVEEAG